MKVGLCTISNKERDVADLIAVAGSIGFDGVEIWGQDHVGDGTERACRTITEAADEAGVDVAVYGSYLRAAGDRDPGTDGTTAGRLDGDTIEHELAVADGIGADLIRIWAGSLEYEDVDDPYWNAVVADVERIGERAEAYGIDVTIEKHANTVTKSLAGARNLIEAVDRENVGLNYQPNPGIDAATLEAEATELAPLTNHMHVLSVHERESDYAFEALLDSFRAGGYEGYVNVEFVSGELPYEEAVRADYDYLRSIID